jgi:menaquinone-9 beta-reductase
MTVNYDVIVVGAGLAGCSAAIQLGNRGLNVLLLEQQRYPIHKLCGEFLSVEVLETFERLGIMATVRQAGAHPIRHAYLSAGGAEFHSNLPGVALGLSRYQLDLMLFQRAMAVGATAYDGTVVKQITGDASQGFLVNTSRGSFRARMVLGAYGKRSALDRDRPSLPAQKSPWIASKGHYTGLSLPGTIELHAFPGGYCGLSQIETGEINLCWIGHDKILQSGGDRGLPGALWQNPVLADRLASLTCTRSLHHLSQISLAMKGNFDGDIWMIGDTAGMIPPLCGDGMAMALRTAELAVPLLQDYLEGRISLLAMKQQYSQAWQREFQLRLRLGRMVHSCFTQPALAQAGVALCAALPPLGNWIIQATRGQAGSLEHLEALTPQAIGAGESLVRTRL